jgi:iron only hydrogenase large subunit-like protein
MFANKLSDLDDFLKPAVECTKPLIAKIDDTNIIDTGIRPNLIKSGTDKIASVTLQDCLACSGCVTSAETVLIQQHSVEELLKLQGQNVYVGISS